MLVPSTLISQSPRALQQQKKHFIKRWTKLFHQVIKTFVALCLHLSTFFNCINHLKNKRLHNGDICAPSYASIVMAEFKVKHIWKRSTTNFLQLRHVFFSRMTFHFTLEAFSNYRKLLLLKLSLKNEVVNKAIALIIQI